MAKGFLKIHYKGLIQFTLFVYLIGFSFCKSAEDYKKGFAFR